MVTCRLYFIALTCLNCFLRSRFLMTLILKRKQKKMFYPNHVTPPPIKKYLKQTSKTLIGGGGNFEFSKKPRTHTPPGVSHWVTWLWRLKPATGRHSHTYICGYGAPATMQTQTLGPKTQQPPLLFILLCSFLSFSFFLFDAPCSSYVRWHAYTYMCVKFIWSKRKYKGGEREREREDRWFQGKKKTISWGRRGGGECEGLKETEPFTPSPTYSLRASWLPHLTHFVHHNISEV